MVAGDGTAPNVSGLLTTLTAADDPTAVSAWDDIVSLVTGGVDGRYALTARDVRLLVASDSYKFASVTRPAAGPHETAVDYLAERTGGVQVCPHIPAAANKIAQVLTVRSITSGAVAPVWEGVSVIEDPFTGAASGKVAFTLHALWAFTVRRSAVFSLQKLKLA